MTQDAMGVWKVSRGAAWETGGAQSLEDLLLLMMEGRRSEETDEAWSGSKRKRRRTRIMMPVCLCLCGVCV